MRRATRLVRFDAAPGDPLSPCVTPIYQTATFSQPSPYDYSRSGNPTRAVLEGQLATLEGARRAFAFGSGMAALGAALRLVPAGGHVVAGDDLYGGTTRLLSDVLARQGVTVDYVDLTDLASLDNALGRRTNVVLFETPSNPLLRIVDVAAVAELARRRGALVAVDASLLSPWLIAPLALGADLVVQSATKLLSGHADLTAGVVATDDPALADEMAFLQNADGTALAPFECWLLLRGLKTLALRAERQQVSARRVAEFLAGHPAVARVYWPGLDSHPGAALHARQARGPGCVVSFTTGCAETSRQMVSALRHFTVAVSFGSVASTVSLPASMSHASVPAALRERIAPPDDLVRLSIGIEDPEDLVEDLDHALSAARGRRVSPCTAPAGSPRDERHAPPR